MQACGHTGLPLFLLNFTKGIKHFLSLIRQIVKEYLITEFVEKWNKNFPKQELTLHSFVPKIPLSSRFQVVKLRTII